MNRSKKWINRLCPDTREVHVKQTSSPIREGQAETRRLFRTTEGRTEQFLAYALNFLCNPGHQKFVCIKPIITRHRTTNSEVYNMVRNQIMITKHLKMAITVLINLCVCSSTIFFTRDLSRSKMITCFFVCTQTPDISTLSALYSLLGPFFG